MFEEGERRPDCKKRFAEEVLMKVAI